MARECQHWRENDVRSVPCPYGMCVQWVCNICNRISGGFGPLVCPCDHTRGWSRSHVEQMGKPPVAVKARGRYAHKVARRRREQRVFDRWLARWSAAVRG